MIANKSVFVAVLIALAFVLPGSADAKKNPLHKVFKGKILVSNDPLPSPDVENVKATIKAYRSQALKTITSDVVDGVPTWQFHFTAFFKTKSKSSNLALEFYTDDKEKLFVADKRLSGADPNLLILSSMVRISEDDNLLRNRKYVMKLVVNKGKKTLVLAETKIKTK
jgi:hypothetical protein